jgi:hypothetical protein
MIEAALEAGGYREKRFRFTSNKNVELRADVFNGCLLNFSNPNVDANPAAADFERPLRGGRSSACVHVLFEKGGVCTIPPFQHMSIDGRRLAIGD